VKVWSGDNLKQFDWRIVVLLVLNVSVALFNWMAPVHDGTVYVLTPMIDIIPGGSPIDETEKKKLLSELRNQSEARDIQKAYAYLGSTLSLHDLLRGIEMVERSEHSLSSKQKEIISHKLQQVQQHHQELQHIQRELIRLESEIVSNVQQIRRGQQ